MKKKLKEKFNRLVNILIDEYDITEEEANKIIDEMLSNPIKDLEQNNRHRFRLTSQELAGFYQAICVDKDRDMSTCPDCEFCPYFESESEKYIFYLFNE